MYIIGNPKIAGSLILNNPGTNAALETALICFDLLFSPITHNGNVFPDPPNIDTAPYKKIGLNTSSFPATANSAFVAYAAI